MQIDLTADEAAVLADILDSALGALREEIYKAEVRDYKVALKQREAIIQRLRERLSARPVVPG